MFVDEFEDNLRTFTVKTIDNRHGYLRRYGYYPPDKLDLLEFTTKRFAGRFRFLTNHAIQEVSTGKCLNFVNAANRQLVLENNCDGSAGSVSVATWRYISSTSYLENLQTGFCLSPWKYDFRAPSAVFTVPGLSECREYNKVILKCKYF